MKFQDRIRELRRVKASELNANPKNWRKHSKRQKDAFKEILSSVGFAEALIAYEDEDKELVLINGHMRTGTVGKNDMIPVLVLDVTEEEADTLLLTMDPLASLSGIEKDNLKLLLEGAEFEDGALSEIMSDLATDAQLDLTPSIPEEDEEDEGGHEEEEEDEAPPSHVRMLNLFLDDETFPEFTELVEKLSDVYGTDNTTDTVRKAVAVAWEVSEASLADVTA